MKYFKLPAVSFIVISMLFSFFGCGKSTTDFSVVNEETEKSVTSEKTNAFNSNAGGVPEERKSLYDEYKYRALYYSVPDPFINLVDRDAFWNWFENETPYRQYPLEDVEEMAIVAFIKEFDISREDFDKANEKHKQILLEYGGMAVMNPGADDPYYDRDIESHEIFNADIIYTFDNEIINAYYLYVDPYENESSTAEENATEAEASVAESSTAETVPSSAE